MTTKAIVELLRPIRRNGVRYPAGFQFERLAVHPRTSLCRDAEGRVMQVPNRDLRVVKPADLPPEPATLAQIVRRGLVRPALEVLAAG